MTEEKKDAPGERQSSDVSKLSGWEAVRIARKANVDLVSVLERHRLIFLWVAEPTSKKGKRPTFPPELHVEDLGGYDRVETVSEEILEDLNAVYEIHRELDQVAKDAKDMISKHAATDAWARHPKAEIRCHNQQIIRRSVESVRHARDVFRAYVGDAIGAIVDNALEESHFDVVEGRTGKDVEVPWSYLDDLGRATDACKRHVVWDFEFTAGGVRYRGRELDLGGRKESRVLTILVRNFDETVPYCILEGKARPISLANADRGQEASGTLKTTIARLRKSLREADVPCGVKNIRYEGYKLLLETN
jgi:hypothetical protein